MKIEPITEETSESEVPPAFASLGMSLVLNTLIVSAYIVIVFLTKSRPWLCFACFLLFAVAIRCATLCWMMLWFGKNVPGAKGFSLLWVLLNLVLGLVFSASLVWGLWWLGHFWLSGIKIIVSFVAVFVAYKSTFPVWSRRSWQVMQ